MKVYCEHGGLTPALRALQRAGKITMIQFPYDPDSASRSINRTAMPSAAQYRDMNLTYGDLNCAYGDFTGSEMLPRIIMIIGPSHRRDALHMDSAHKSKCRAFVTRDTDILKHSGRLEQLLGIQIINPDTDHQILLKLLDESEAI
jgi:hypothetical protein